MDSLIIEYENTLIGKLDHVDPCNFYSSEAKDLNQVKALACIQYAIEDILLWDVDEAIKKFDSYMLNLMKLDKMISYIQFPIEVPYGDPLYILSLIYPDKIKLTHQDLVQKTFINVIENEGKQFPREYFVGGAGFQRFCYCLKYIIENKKSFSSIEEIYDYLDSAEGKEFLDKYRLKTPAYQFYINTFDALHYITRDNDNSDFWYNFKTFQQKFRKVQA